MELFKLKLHKFTRERESRKWFFTCGLGDIHEVSRHCRLESKSESHDGEGHGAAALRGCPADESSDDHGDRHQVVVGKVGEVVVLEGKHPPANHLWKTL